jgi:hypothetical protein
MVGVLIVSFLDEDIWSLKRVMGHWKALYISYHMYGSKLHEGGEKYRRSFIVIVIHAFDLSFFTPRILSGRITNPRRRGCTLWQRGRFHPWLGEHGCSVRR